MLKPEVCRKCAEKYLGKMIGGMTWLQKMGQRTVMLERWLRKFDELRFDEKDPFINCPTNVPYDFTGFAYPDDEIAPEWCPYQNEHKE
jgi:hypothetical protein